MTQQEMEADLLRRVLGLDRSMLSPSQVEQAVEAALATRAGRAIHHQYVNSLSEEELHRAIVQEHLAIDPTGLTPEQFSVALEEALAVFKEERSVPEGEWSELLAWLDSNRDAVNALEVGQMIRLPDGRTTNWVNLSCFAGCTARDDPDARRLADDVAWIRGVVNGTGEPHPYELGRWYPDIDQMQADANALAELHGKGESGVY